MTLMPKTLYICYFGMREPLVQTQVLPYLRELRKSGQSEKGKEEKSERGGEAGAVFPIGVFLLTFEPAWGEADKAAFAAIRDELAREGIEWEWLPYHKRFSALATAWDILRGTVRVWRMHRRTAFDVLHCRVHVPAVMAAAARKFMRRKPKVLFDIRGFFPEEFVDGGLWPEDGILFRTAKRVERWLMKEADGFVVLTEKAREILFPESKDTGFDAQGRPIEVIPCCVDLQRFAEATPESRAEMRAKLGIEDRKVLVYVGSFGGWYLTKETADMFAAFFRRYPNAFALILTQGKPEMIEPHLRERGISPEDYLITKIPSTEMPRYLSAADVAVSFAKPSYSKKSSSPTKNAEYLACGLPIIANPGVGDVEEMIVENLVGTLLPDFSRDGYSAALEEIERLGDIADKCRETARREFDLETVAGEKYRRLYSRLL